MVFDKIFPQAKDKNVSNVVLYADSNSKLWVDSKKTVKATCAIVEDLFKKGHLLVDDGTSLYAPTKLTVASTPLATVVCVDDSGASSAPAVVAFTSQENA